MYIYIYMLSVRRAAGRAGYFQAAAFRAYCFCCQTPLTKGVCRPWFHFGCCLHKCFVMVNYYGFCHLCFVFVFFLMLPRLFVDGPRPHGGGGGPLGFGCPPPALWTAPGPMTAARAHCGFGARPPLRTATGPTVAFNRMPLGATVNL